MQFWETCQIFPAQLPEMIRKKVHKRCKNFSKVFSSKSSHGYVESSLKAPPRWFFSDSQRKVFRSIFKKSTICKFCKKLSPESFHWNWESSFDNSATFFARICQKNRSVSKNEKKLEIKLFFVKMLFWTRRKQLQHPCRKTRKGAEDFLLNVWKW